ncbi:dihydrolipoamide acetyltransferase family protein [Neobacillus rhizophilus]|uniref:Dihydrolipoamide acetyltransferase component of pyruvate dehydrogenase complex n=1 Tax=Neobacillus rhizophilus TaxID=2833579 RepID=A0A942U4G2_9BACI|nr:dihydrolipoamide acetyltransferase family protein [Neobacillus rhizophilus]MBS4210879.1 2-oxo acid dehydrogenase subunit E2 [Neobacillus rhizophilus]
MNEVKMPRLGVTMQAGTVANWLLEEGDFVEKGDYLFEMETEKATVEIEAMNSGVLRKIIIPEGQEVPVNTVIAILAEEDEEINLSPYLEAQPAEEATVQVAAAVEAVAEKQEAAGKVGGGGKAAPKARQLAKQLGIDLATVIGTGKDGLITEKDVQNAAAVTETTAELRIKETIPLNHVKKSMSENMLNSWRNIPQFTQIVSVNMTQVLKAKKELGGVSINDVIVKAVANVVREYSIVNSRLEENKIVVFEDVNISVAVNSGQGLVVPVVKNADSKSVSEISKEIKALSEKANNNQLTLDDYANGTITVSNLGSLGIETGTPIINAPQSTIIFAGSIQKTPVVNEFDEIVVAPMMKLSIAYDHRFIDGVTAAGFTNAVKNALENLSVHSLA